MGRSVDRHLLLLVVVLLLFSLFTIHHLFIIHHRNQRPAFSARLYDTASKASHVNRSMCGTVHETNCVGTFLFSS